MAKHGTIRRWDADKGFGFISSPEVSADVFFHISTFKCQAGMLPNEGLAVQFEEIFVGSKGFKATRVLPVTDRRPQQARAPQASFRQPAAQTARPLALVPKRMHRQPDAQAGNTHRITRQRPRPRGSARRATANAPASRLGAFLVCLLVWSGLLVFGLLAHRLSVWVLPGLAALNVITLFAYAFDKSAAERGRWRTQENTLHLFALAGGWPTAWLAQRLLRHKTSKDAFQAAYWASAVLHCLALAAWVVGAQDQFLRHLK